ncbi:hypothetical protein [Candidatus Sneabacter namystus]|uniref:Uncharacterized protein n=1 Tax=Candidatus Sneabacter namystus TaxID=2601646 RepID=A0A5C0UIJ7_9RICK|nr:hypothetical protein [Candidatus Sneabacter namystus]QEK39619.1 hypothetical protein FZC37_01565 [Candidatus Sneabacter namystus]
MPPYKDLKDMGFFFSTSTIENFIPNSSNDQAVVEKINEALKSLRIHNIQAMSKNLNGKPIEYSEKNGIQKHIAHAKNHLSFCVVALPSPRPKENKITCSNLNEVAKELKISSNLTQEILDAQGLNTTLNDAKLAAITAQKSSNAGSDINTNTQESKIHTSDIIYKTSTLKDSESKKLNDVEYANRMDIFFEKLNEHVDKAQHLHYKPEAHGQQYHHSELTMLVEMSKEVIDQTIETAKKVDGKAQVFIIFDSYPNTMCGNLCRQAILCLGRVIAANLGDKIVHRPHVIVNSRQFYHHKKKIEAINPMETNIYLPYFIEVLPSKLIRNSDEEEILPNDNNIGQGTTAFQSMYSKEQTNEQQGPSKKKIDGGGNSILNSCFNNNNNSSKKEKIDDDDIDLKDSYKSQSNNNLTSSLKGKNKKRTNRPFDDKNGEPKQCSESDTQLEPPSRKKFKGNSYNMPQEKEDDC